MKKFWRFFAVSFLAFFFAHSALAAINFSPNLALTFGLTTLSLKALIIKVVNYLLGFLGIIAVAIMAYGGFMWMTSQGVPQKIERAKKILLSGAIGLIIILLSFAIVLFVKRMIMGNSNGSGSSGSGTAFSALGGGIIESVYPAPGQLNVARNTKIIVTFKEPIDPSTIIHENSGDSTLGDFHDTNGNGVLDSGEAYDNIATTGGVPNVKISLQSQAGSGPYLTDVFVSKSADNKTFVFTPLTPLGSATQKEWYTIQLSGNIKKADGSSALGSLGFSWSFQTGTFIDKIPPHIVSVMPIAGGTYARNIVIQIQFSEAINPLSVNGSAISVTAGGSPVTGHLVVANQYQTVDFLGSACGQNSCGETIYCLPGNKDIQVTVKAAPLSGMPPLAQGPPYQGIVDMAGNSLDGNNNGAAQGPPTDNYKWTFKTNNSLYLIPPYLQQVSPSVNEKGINLRNPISALFSTTMMYGSLNSEGLKIVSPLTGYWITAQEVKTSLGTTTEAYINHFKFNVKTAYKTEINAHVKDIYQNCFYPSKGPGCSPPAPAGQECCCAGVWHSYPCP